MVLLNFVAGYLLGSLLFSPLVAKFFGFKVPKSLRNLGGAHIYELTRSKTVLVLGVLLDFLKGLVAFLLFGKEGALGALVGHMWSIFFEFRGGRGATAITPALLFLAPDIILVYAIFSGLRFLLFPGNRRIRETLDFLFRTALAFLVLVLKHEHALFIFLAFLLIDLKYLQEGDVDWKLSFLRTHT